MGCRKAPRSITVLLAACLLSAQATAIAAGSVRFRRGDANADGRFELADSVSILGFLFLGKSPPTCLDAADSDDSGRLDINDPVLILNYLFAGRGAIASPGPARCGADLTADNLGCESHAPCAAGSSRRPAAPDIRLETDETRDRVVRLTGSTSPGYLVELTSSEWMEVRPVDDRGRFAADLPLEINRRNRIFATAIAPDGTRSAPAPALVVQDASEPFLHVDYPRDGAIVTQETVTVTGRVGDLLCGHRGIEVEVNGRPAHVLPGVGTNGTFVAAEIPLPERSNLIALHATDILGNRLVRTIKVTRSEVTGPRLMLAGGDGQSGPVRGLLAEPLSVNLTGEDGKPLAGKLVSFEVTRSDGVLFDAGAPDAAGEAGPSPGARSLKLETDADGIAAVRWRLGTDAGCGNNRVRITSTGISDVVIACASALLVEPRQINIGAGNRQQVEAGALSTDPLRVWVSDGVNGIEGVPVLFTVLAGGGLVLGDDSAEIPTDITGHAEVPFMAGPEPGWNLVAATFPGNPGLPATFSIQALPRGEEDETTFTGIVLDNANRPIGGVPCILGSASGGMVEGVTDLSGRFHLRARGAGPGWICFDGLAATYLGGPRPRDIPPGSFPSLCFDIVVVPGIENSLPGPVFLPELDPRNARTYDGTEDVTLTVAGVEGLEMVVKAGSMRLRNGARPSPERPVLVALNQVHTDNVPMPFPDGLAPPFAWTLQPSGATFDPPATIVFPNMEGLRPGAIANFYSFDHDTNRFEIAASGQVSPDGSIIRSDPASGIAKAGWGAGEAASNPTGEASSPAIAIIDLPPEIRTDETPGVGVAWLDAVTEVTFKVLKNGTEVASFSRTAVDTAVVSDFDTSSSSASPGDIYTVTATTSDGRELVSESCTVIPGLPSSLSVSLSKSSIVADDHDTITLQAVIRDSFGNAVADGTGIQFVQQDGLGGMESGLFAETDGGEATAILKAPIAKDFKVNVIVAPISEEVEIPVTALTGALSASASTLDVTGPDSSTVTLTTNASDGAEVFWTISNYPSGSSSTIEGTISGGTSSIAVEASGARVGPCTVTATIASRLFATTIDFTSSASLSVEVDRPVIVGSITEDGTSTLVVTAVDLATGDLETGSSVVVREVEVARYGVATAKIHGSASTTFVVSLDDSRDAAYVSLEGLTSANEITTDTSGEASFRVRSAGAYTRTGSEYIRGISFTVSEKGGGIAALLGRGAGVPSCTEIVHVTDPTFWDYYLDSVSSFWGGDPKTPAGVPANVLGGMLLVGDVGSLVKNGWRQTGFSDEEPNYLESGLSGLGLLTELAVGAGETADAPISGVRAIIAFVGEGKFSELLVILLKRALSNAEDLAKFTSFVTKLTTKPTFLEAAKSIYTSEEVMNAGIRVVDTFGDDFADGVAELAERGTITVGAFKAATELLDTLDATTLAAIKSSGAAKEAIQGLIKVLNMGIDGEAIRKALANTDLFYPASVSGVVTKYTQADLLMDLGDIADATVTKSDALTRLLSGNGLLNTGTGKWGFRYELEVAVHLVRNQGNAALDFVSKYLPADHGLKPTDLDVIYNNVAYQAKRSKDAFDSGIQGVEDWISKAKTLGGASDVKYAVPCQSNALQHILQAIPADIYSHLLDRGVEVVCIPFK